MKIVEYDKKHINTVKDLLSELQEYLVKLDSRKVLVLKDDYRDRYFEYVTEDVKNNHGKIFIAENGNRAVGLVICKIYQGGGEQDITTACPKVGFISDLVVKETERGKGIGKLLISEAEKYFKSKACEYSQLEVFAPNKNAFELYKKLGYGVLLQYMSKKI